MFSPRVGVSTSCPLTIHVTLPPLKWLFFPAERALAGSPSVSSSACSRTNFGTGFLGRMTVNQQYWSTEANTKHWPWTSDITSSFLQQTRLLKIRGAAPITLILQCQYHIHTTTPPPPQPFYGPFSGTTWVSRCQKRTSALYGAREDLTQAGTPTIRLGATPSRPASAHLHLPPIFLQAGCLSCPPNQQRQSTEGN